MNLSRARLVLFSTLLAIFASAGCSKSNASGGETYCDDNGCYVCGYGEGACWPINNAPCDGDSDCASGQSCTVMGCAAQCSRDASCGDTERCVEGLCVLANFPLDRGAEPATGDGNQSDGGAAADGTGGSLVGGFCEQDEECAEGLVCLQDNNTCAPRCDIDDDCAADEVCLECGKCQKKELPATCGRSPDYCEEGKALSCGLGKTCLAGRCHFDCGVGFRCPVGQVCGAGVCRQDANPVDPECVLDVHCGAGACINGYCHAACVLSDECGDAMVCRVAICQPDFRPAA